MTNLVLDRRGRDARARRGARGAPHAHRQRPLRAARRGVQAALFAHHPYGTPIIGWKHEIEGLDREDALAYYTPLLYAGERHPRRRRRRRGRGGRAPRQGDLRQDPGARRAAARAPPAGAAARAPIGSSRSPTRRSSSPRMSSVFLVPVLQRRRRPARPRRWRCWPICSAAARPARSTTRWWSTRRSRSAPAPITWARRVDDTRLWVYATPAPERFARSSSTRAIDRVADSASPKSRSTRTISQRAKTRLIADAIYAQDSQASLARWYGEALATGLTIDDVVAWPDRIEPVTADDVAAAARKWLDKRRAVTGFLLPAETKRPEHAVGAAARDR